MIQILSDFVCGHLASQPTSTNLILQPLGLAWQLVVLVGLNKALAENWLGKYIYIYMYTYYIKHIYIYTY